MEDYGGDPSESSSSISGASSSLSAQQPAAAAKKKRRMRGVPDPLPESWQTSERRTRHAPRYHTGETVWCRREFSSAAWWPAKIENPFEYPESLELDAPVGTVLVKLFGREGEIVWMHDKDLVPFDINMEEFSHLSSDDDFVKAVAEVVRRRAR